MQRGFEAFRDAARKGVERMGFYAVMAETTGARGGGPRIALLDEVRDADAFILVLGPRYGAPGASGFSQTEDEYNEAVALCKPIFVFVQETEMDDDQRQFLARVRGSWDRGELYEKFITPEELTLAIATALGIWRSAAAPEDATHALEKAVALVRGDSRLGTISSGVAARIALVPTVSLRLLGHLELEDRGLPNALLRLAREVELAPQSVGLNYNVSAGGVTITSVQPEEWVPVLVQLGSDGTVLAQVSVRSTSSRFASLVDPDRFEAFVVAAGAFARRAWSEIHATTQIKRLAVTTAIPEASYKGWGNFTGDSMRMPAASFDATAPVPPQIYLRSAVGEQRFGKELTAAMARAFADAGAIPTSPSW